MPSAIVTGATGITGSAIVHHLLKDGSYDKIYSFSRGNPGHKDPKVQHVTLDLQSSTIHFKNKPPLKASASALGLSTDSVSNDSPTLFLQVDPEKWAKREDVNKAWATLRERYNLDQHAWDKATWNFLTMTLGRDWSCVGSMSKARKLGWTGYADTWDELEETFEILESEGVLPPLNQLRKDF